jgi:phosphatidylglycerol:prolipoprotein diacylglycerol transferase
MPAYALGRLGCHLVGDGDWGIINGNTKPVSWIPDWLWGYTYPHNIIGEAELIPACTWDNYCYQLSNPVYPTSLYESIIILTLFYILWKLRLRIKMVGRITSIYLMMISIERFFMEFIKINKHYEVIGLSFSQAQLTSIGIFIVGLTLYFYAPSLKANNEKS